MSFQAGGQKQYLPSISIFSYATIFVILFMLSSSSFVGASTLYRNLLASPFLLVISQLHLLLRSQVVIMMKTKGFADVDKRDIAVQDSRREETLQREEPLEVFCSQGCMEGEKSIRCSLQ